MKPSSEQLEFVEKVGRFFESTGVARTIGRIMGWLMISEPDHQSAAELQEALGISAGSVSTNVRQMEQAFLLERTTFPGDRSSYYRIPDQMWMRLMGEEVARLTTMSSLVDAAKDVMPVTRPERVTDIAVIGDFFIDEWPGLLKRLAQRLKEA